MDGMVCVLRDSQRPGQQIARLRGNCGLSWVSQVCTVTVSTGACFLCQWTQVPLAAYVGYPGTNRDLRLWRSLRRLGEC